MLTTNKKVMDKAYKKKYAVGAFNTNNMEITQSIIRAAVAEKSPVIISTSEGAIDYARIDYLKALIETASDASVPVTMHLDHGKSMKYVRMCVKAGYTSVMLDGSHLPYEENVSITRKVVKVCKPKGISVEGELGTIGGTEDKVSARKIIYTEVADAVDFVAKTGVDSLAVAIGTSHGAYKFAGKAKLDIKRLADINKALKMPLVLHGASGIPQDVVRMAKKYGAKLGHPHGVPDSQIRTAVKHGVAKVNLDSDIRLAFDAGVRQVIMEKPSVFDPRKILGPARDLMETVVRKRMRVLGSSGRA